MTLAPAMFVVEPGKELTRRENDVLNQVLEGKTTRAMARDLGVSERTIQTNLKSLLGKIQGTLREHIAQRLDEQPKAYQASFCHGAVQVAGGQERRRAGDADRGD